MSERSSRVRSGGRRRLAAFAGVLGVLMFTSGLSLVVQSGSSAVNAATWPSDKVWVCKFVTDPKGVTRLKTGNDGLVDVSINALKGFHGLGSLFNDKHVKSIAVAWGNQPKPVVAIVDGVCKAVTPPTQTPTPTPTPTSTSTQPTSGPTSSTPTPTSSTPTPTPTSSAPAPKPTKTKPASHPSVVVPTKVHSGLESVGSLTSVNSPMRVLGLGLAGLGSIFMVGSMGLFRRATRR